jgi:hypothetical protein
MFKAAVYPNPLYKEGLLLYFLVYDFTTLPVARSYGWRLAKYYPGINLEGVKKATKNLIHGSHFSSRNPKLSPPNYKCTALPLYQTAQFLLFATKP